jgi:hypothetical protein
VEYIKEEGDTRETFRGESITVNLDNWSSTFLNGETERALSADQTAFRFAGEVISRNDQEVTVLANADVSNATNAEAFWSVHASRLWLLPGSDWAFLNAVLKVGEIPIFYLPFFFYPSDELVFRPVLGYRSREGTFFQTTTYILGRPRAESATESSLTRIMGGGSDMERTREGIFLRSTGRKTTDPNTTRLSLLLDAYANLGVYAGTELALPSKGVFGPLNVSFGLGFTRTIYQQTSGVYTPFTDNRGESDWNSSRIFSFPLPYLRYRLKATGSFSSRQGSMNWSFPFYSDPFVEQDFLNRSETLDWFKMLRGQEEETTETKTDPLGSYEWRVTASATPSLPALAPYVSRLSISSLTSAVSYGTRSASGFSPTDPSPERTFFYPDKLTIYSISTAISGTPLTLGYTGSTAAAAPASGEEPSQEDPLKNLGEPRPPWDTAGNEQTAGTLLDPLRPPVMAQQFELFPGGGPQFTIDYSLNPAGATELQFDSSTNNWKTAADVNWGDVSSILTNFRTDGNFTFTFKEPATSFYTTSLRFSGSASWQDYLLLNENAGEFSSAGAADNARSRAYNATAFTTSSEFTTTIKPLYNSAVWGNSNVQYTLRGLIAKSAFVGTGQDPDWDILFGKWDNTNIETHRIAANLAASVMDKNQTLSLSTDLPPKDAAISEDAFFRVWVTETNIRSKLKDPFDTQTWDPLYVTETLRFSTDKYLQQSLVYTPDVDDFTNLTTSFVWKGLSASFVAGRSLSYRLNTATGWETIPNSEKLNMREFRLGLVEEFKRDSLWNNRFSFRVRVNSGLSFDLQRYTYSKFTFNLGVTLGITNFLDFSLDTTSENTVIFRYFQNLPFINFSLPPTGEQNVLIDLLNSFRFDNEALRQSSGFKLKSVKLTALHYLGDWTAKLGVTMTPYLDNATMRYKLNPEISFLVQWVPVGEIKSEIFHDKDKFTVR